MAAMLPVYNFGVSDPQTQLETIVEQSLKASCLNLGGQQTNSFSNGVNPFTDATVPIMAAVAAAAGSSISNISNPLFSVTNNSLPIPSNSQSFIGDGSNHSTVSATLMMPSATPSFSNSAGNLTLNTDVNKISPQLFASPTTFQIPKPQPISISQQSANDAVSAIISFAQQQAKLASPVKNLSFQNIANSTANLISPNFNTLLPPAVTTSKDVTNYDDLLELDLFNPPINNLTNVEPSTSFQTNVSSVIQPPVQQQSVPEPDNKSTKANTSRDIDNDKELDQWLSMAVEGHLSPEEPASPEAGDLFIAETTGFSLDPIMFTPPDSPSNDKKTSEKKSNSKKSEPIPAKKIKQPPMAETFKAPVMPVEEPVVPQVPLAAESLMFLPKTEKRISHERVPVYKRKASAISTENTLEKALEKVAKIQTSDEYSFMEEDEPVKPLQNAINTTNDSDICDNPASSPTVTEVLKKKTEENEPVENNFAEEKAIVEHSPNNLLKTIRNRKEQAQQLDSVLIYSEIIWNDDNAYIPSKIFEQREKFSNGFSEPQIVSKHDNIIQPKIEPQSPEHVETNNVTIKQEPVESVRIIPKLVIKLPKRENIVISPEAPKEHKKKKKKHKKHHDSEWMPSEEKRKKKKHKRRSHDREIRKDVVEIPSTRLSEIKVERIPELSRETIRSSKSSIEKRLSYLGFASGDSPKGTFVVSKTDVFKSDCPLWKVDNQNLLQKYPQVLDDSNGTKSITYKNSSTYSGWCDQVAAGYLTIQCKYLKHTRAESIVEPEIPIVDLIPAVSDIVHGQDAFGLIDEPSSDDVFEPISMTLTAAADSIRSYMRSFTLAMLKQAANMNFLQTVKKCNDWDYLVALNEVEMMTTLGKQKINEKIRWSQHFEVALTIYPNMTVIDSCLIEDGDICQACGDNLAIQSIQVYSNDSYNYDTLYSEDLPEIDEVLHSAIEFAACLNCCRLASLYHQLHHMKFNIFKLCEDMLENISSHRPDLSPEAVAMICMSKRSWQRKLINDYASLWKRVQENDL
uniref:DUF4211 domain-containing protein n=1 Tax=Panagrolaimus sp. JU765 TaxID=591449 RepID=A0AC34QBA3_9BILA